MNSVLVHQRSSKFTETNFKVQNVEDIRALKKASISDKKMSQQFEAGSDDESNVSNRIRNLKVIHEKKKVADAKKESRSDHRASVRSSLYNYFNAGNDSEQTIPITESCSVVSARSLRRRRRRQQAAQNIDNKKTSTKALSEILNETTKRISSGLRKSSSQRSFASASSPRPRSSKSLVDLSSSGHSTASGKPSRCRSSKSSVSSSKSVSSGSSPRIRSPKKSLQDSQSKSVIAKPRLRASKSVQDSLSKSVITKPGLRKSKSQLGLSSRSVISDTSPRLRKSKSPLRRPVASVGSPLLTSSKRDSSANSVCSTSRSVGSPRKSSPRQTTRRSPQNNGVSKYDVRTSLRKHLDQPGEQGPSSDSINGSSESVHPLDQWHIEGVSGIPVFASAQRKHPATIPEVAIDSQARVTSENISSEASVGSSAIRQDRNQLDDRKSVGESTASKKQTTRKKGRRKSRKRTAPVRSKSLTVDSSISTTNRVASEPTRLKGMIAESHSNGFNSSPQTNAQWNLPKASEDHDSQRKSPLTTNTRGSKRRIRKSISDTTLQNNKNYGSPSRHNAQWNKPNNYESARNPSTKQRNSLAQYATKRPDTDRRLLVKNTDSFVDSEEWVTTFDRSSELQPSTVTPFDDNEFTVGGIKKSRSDSRLIQQLQQGLVTKSRKSRPADRFQQQNALWQKPSHSGKALNVAPSALGQTQGHSEQTSNLEASDNDDMSVLTWGTRISCAGGKAPAFIVQSVNNRAYQRAKVNQLKLQEHFGRLKPLPVTSGRSVVSESNKSSCDPVLFRQQFVVNPNPN